MSKETVKVPDIGGADAAEVVELHTHSMKDGMMQMRRVEKIDIPAGAETKLQPGGLHVMMIGLKQELKPEQEVTLTLVFEDGSKAEVTAPVRKLQMKKKKKKKEEDEATPAAGEAAAT